MYNVPDLVYYLIVITVALCFGSLVTCLSYRLPRSITLSRFSYCPHCRHRLRLINMLPLISWLVQLGKCQYCTAPISVRYPLIELITASILTYSIYLYGINLPAILICATLIILIIIAIIDHEHGIIPDTLQLLLLIVVITYVYVSAKHLLLQAILWGVMLSVLGVLVSKTLTHIINKDCLGMGDIKFFCMVGILLHRPAYIIFFFLLSGIAGIISAFIYRREDKSFPFAPALVFALIINIFIQQYPVPVTLLSFYMDLFE